MNKIKKCLICMLGVVMLLPATVHADYFCDFESGADDWVCTPSGFIYDSNGGVAKGVGVVADPENPENQVLLIDGTPGEASAVINFEDMHGVIEISLKVRFDNMGSTVFNHAGVSSKDGAVISPMIHVGWFIYTNSKGNLVYTDGADPGAWLDVRYLIDTGALTYSAFVKGGMYETEKQMAKNYPLKEKAIMGINSFSSTANDAQIYIDDVKITRLGDSETINEIWMYSNCYKIDYSAKTIGNIRYNTPKKALLDTLVFKQGVEATISGDGDYFLGGEKLVLKNSANGTQQVYSINVRTNSMTKLYNKLLNDTTGAFPTPFIDAF